ncbi:sarcosine oxidase subunit delta [Yoonia sp.]|uniref:sarcosine oxidase subunit delta n=1 Tax=Yoonia sp. TaxID=2212373 RepID=UPI003F6C0D77
MRIACPNCGDRDRREFYYQGHAVVLSRPSRDAGDQAWNDYLHNRDNPAGMTRDVWYHEGGCGAWLVVERNTLTHTVQDVTLAEKAPR